ncbi:MAG: transcriptional repressor NrdR [Myxococcales bacterium]|nr:transcriptional repressor NrdR [Myxococcales bacterium]
MRCPYCGSDQSKVMDSRFRKEGNVIRRRRECLKCERRFTTYERIEEILPHVVKKDGRREPFDRQKIYAGISRACEKLSVSIDQMEDLVSEVERHFSEQGDREISSRDIGEYVVSRLKYLHPVAYVRFASVYRSFKDVDAFMAELKEILDERKSSGA